MDDCYLSQSEPEEPTQEAYELARDHKKDEVFDDVMGEVGSVEFWVKFFASSEEMDREKVERLFTAAVNLHPLAGYPPEASADEIAAYKLFNKFRQGVREFVEELEIPDDDLQGDAYDWQATLNETKRMWS